MADAHGDKGEEKWEGEEREGDRGKGGSFFIV